MADSISVARGFTPPGRRVLWAAAVMIALLVIGVAWSLGSPVGSSPDDDFHVTSIWCSGSRPTEQCEPVGGSAESGVEMVRVPREMTNDVIDCFKFKPDESAACTRLPADSPYAVTRANTGAYPGGYYAAMSLFAGTDVERSVVMMRVLTWIWACVLIGSSVLVADRAARPSMVTGVLVSSVPMLVFIAASTNPSGWTVAGTVASFFAATAGLRAPTRARQWFGGVIAVVAAVTALSPRPDGGLWVGTAMAAAILVHCRRVRDVTAKLAVPATIGALCGLYLMFFTSSTAITQRGLSLGPQNRPFWDVVYKNLSEIPYLWTGSLGTASIGWFDTPMPALVPAAMVGVWAAAGAIGLGRPERSNLRALAFLLLCAIAVPLYLLAADGSVVPEGIQPRYLLPLLPMSIVAALLRPVGWTPVRFSRPQLAVMGGAIAVAHAVALHANMRRWITGRDVFQFDLGHAAEWWWDGAPAPMLVWFAGSFAGLAVVVLLGIPQWRAAGRTSVLDRTAVAGVAVVSSDLGPSVDHESHVAGVAGTSPSAPAALHGATEGTTAAVTHGPG